VKEEYTVDSLGVDFKLLIPEINEILVEEPNFKELNNENALIMPKTAVKQIKTEPPVTYTPNTVSKKNVEAINQKVADNCKMQCDICSTFFHEWVDVANHFKTNHQMKGYVLCICCNKKFYRKCMLLDHVEVRLNPEAFK
jgi:hypothetical protein